MGDDQRLRLWPVRLEMFLRHPYGADKSLGPGTDPTGDTMWLYQVGGGILRHAKHEMTNWR